MEEVLFMMKSTGLIQICDILRKIFKSFLFQWEATANCTTNKIAELYKSLTKEKVKKVDKSFVSKDLNRDIIEEMARDLIRYDEQFKLN